MANSKESKCNKGNFTFPPPHTIELQSNKKVATPAFLNQPTPFAGLYPLFSQISGTPLVTQFLEDPTPPLISDGVGGGGGGSNYVMMVKLALM